MEICRGEYTVPSTAGNTNRLLKNARLRRFPHPSSLRRTSKYASLLRISGALQLGIFEQPAKNDFSSKLLDLHLVFPEPFTVISKGPLHIPLRHISYLFPGL